MAKKSKFPFEVVFEDNHLVVINKPSGYLVQGDSTGDAPLSELVKQYVKEKYNKAGDVFLGVPHRIDRPVSGVLVFARTSKALERLNKMFQEKTFHKTYWAIVGKKPPLEDETLVHYLKKNQEKNKSRGYDKEVKGSKRCELDYRITGRSKNYYFLEVKPTTGRHHQIRVQLSKVGCPIKGDMKYGYARSNKEGGISLHARSITFIHPVKKEEITIKAKPPKDPLWNEFLTMNHGG